MFCLRGNIILFDSVQFMFVIDVDVNHIKYSFHNKRCHRGTGYSRTSYIESITELYTDIFAE